MNYITDENQLPVQQVESEPILVADRELQTQGGVGPNGPIVIQTGNGRGGGSMSGGLMVILLLALITILFFGTDMHLKLKDFLKDVLDIATGGSEEGVTPVLVDPENPQADELESTSMQVGVDWVSWKFAMFIMGLRDGTVRTANSIAEAEDATPKTFRFTSEWDGDIQHDVSYFDMEGLLIFGTPTWHLQDYADADDTQWQNAFLRVVTVGLWFIAEYTAPRNSWCVVDIVGVGGGSGSYLEDAQLMFAGNIPQDHGHGEDYMAEKIRGRNSFYTGNKPLKIANLEVVVNSLSSPTADNRTIDVRNWTITGNKVLMAKMSSGSFVDLISITSADFPFTELPSSFRNLPTVSGFGASWDAQRSEAMNRAKAILEEVNEYLDILLTAWDAAGQPDEFRPYSIPGCLKPANRIVGYYVRNPQRSMREHLWEDLINHRISPDTWMWEVINRLQMEYADYRFYYGNVAGCGGGRGTILQAADSGWRDACQNAACELAAIGYWIYISQICIDGRSLFRMSYVGKMWGRNTWIGAAPSTDAAIAMINEAQHNESSASVFSWIQGSTSQSLENVEVSEDILKNKCMPTDCEWIKKGAPSEWVRFGQA